MCFRKFKSQMFIIQWCSKFGLMQLARAIHVSEEGSTLACLAVADTDIQNAYVPRCIYIALRPVLRT